jgi:hypothetical protein
MRVFHKERKALFQCFLYCLGIVCLSPDGCLFESCERPFEQRRIANSVTVLDPTASSSALPPSSIVWNWSDFFYSANTKACPSQGPYSSLSTSTWRPGARPSWRTNLDMYGVDSPVFGDCGCVGCGPHCGVRRGFQSVSFDEHASGGPRDGLSPGDIRDVDEGVVIGAVDMDDCPFFRFLAQASATSAATRTDALMG